MLMFIGCAGGWEHIWEQTERTGGKDGGREGNSGKKKRRIEGRTRRGNRNENECGFTNSNFKALNVRRFRLIYFLD